MREFDYHTPGAHFFTVCLNNRIPILSTVQDGLLLPSDIGEMVIRIWNSTSVRYLNVETDSIVVMPDHLHGIVILHSVDEGLSPISFPKFMNWFKSITTVEYGRGVKNTGWPAYDRHLWQPDYIERALRDDVELERYRRYIEGNPGRWESNQL